MKSSGYVILGHEFEVRGGLCVHGTSSSFAPASIIYRRPFGAKMQKTEKLVSELA